MEAKKSKAEIAQEKEIYAQKIKDLHASVMGFCTGPPRE